MNSNINVSIVKIKNFFNPPFCNWSLYIYSYFFDEALLSILSIDFLVFVLIQEIKYNKPPIR